MNLTEDQVKRLEHFYASSDFSTAGAVFTDLDGTAVHEVEGKVIIHDAVELGLKRIYDVGRPIIINTLRFPLSVIRTFALDWYTISNAAIPVVLLNGSQLGFITKTGDEFAFEQSIAFPLTDEEIRAVIDRVKRFAGDSIQDIILFYYPENWENGEIIWTPDEATIPQLQTKYRSASSVISMPLDDLAVELLSNPICMVLLLVNIPGDKLMAYQHTRRSHFITHEGVDKLSGAKKMAELLNVDLHHSIGAGDSDMDNFLKAVGLAVHVGNPHLSFAGVRDTLRLRDFAEFGNLLFRLAALQTSTVK